MSDREYEIWRNEREQSLEKLKEIERGGYEESYTYEPLPWAGKEETWL